MLQSIPKSVQKLGLAELEIYLSEAYASTVADYRLRLRHALAQSLDGQLDAHETKGILDLSTPPRLSTKKISISHCRDLGGWAKCISVESVGFDVESEVRVRPDLIARVARPQEISSAPHPAALWVAKEASFKKFSLQGLEPQIIADIDVLFEPLSDDAYIFRASWRSASTPGASWKVSSGIWAGIC